MIRRLYPSQSNDASPETDFDPADGAPPLAVATLQDSGSAPSPDALPPLPLVAPQMGTSATSANAGAPVSNTYTATFSYSITFTEFVTLGADPQPTPEPWQANVLGQISISGGVNLATWTCTIAYSGTPLASVPGDSLYVPFSSAGSVTNDTNIIFRSNEVDAVMDTDDGGTAAFFGTPSSDQTQITGEVDIQDNNHWADILVVPNVTLTSGGGPPPPPPANPVVHYRQRDGRFYRTELCASRGDQCGRRALQRDGWKRHGGIAEFTRWQFIPARPPIWCGRNNLWDNVGSYSDVCGWQRRGGHQRKYRQHNGGSRE
jgi:hypothetical protein